MISFAKYHARRFLVFLLLFWIAAHAASALEAQRLVLFDRNGTRLFTRDVRPGDRFAIVFTHSLALSTVEEVFETIPCSRFRLIETRYEDFGAGLPHEEMPGQTMRFENGRIILDGYTAEFDELWLRVGHIANHRLVAPSGESICLRDLAEPGQAVRIAIEDALLEKLE